MKIELNTKGTQYIKSTLNFISALALCLIVLELFQIARQSQIKELCSRFSAIRNEKPFTSAERNKIGRSIHKKMGTTRSKYNVAQLCYGYLQR